MIFRICFYAMLGLAVMGLAGLDVALYLNDGRPIESWHPTRDSWCIGLLCENLAYRVGLIGLLGAMSLAMSLSLAGPLYAVLRCGEWILVRIGWLEPEG